MIVQHVAARMTDEPLAIPDTLPARWWGLAKQSVALSRQAAEISREAADLKRRAYDMRCPHYVDQHRRCTADNVPGHKHRVSDLDTLT
jgi:hypothetical protein